MILALVVSTKIGMIVRDQLCTYNSGVALMSGDVMKNAPRMDRSLIKPYTLQPKPRKSNQMRGLEKNFTYLMQRQKKSSTSCTVDAHHRPNITLLTPNFCSLNGQCVSRGEDKRPPNCTSSGEQY